MYKKLYKHTLYQLSFWGETVSLRECCRATVQKKCPTSLQPSLCSSVRALYCPNQPRQGQGSLLWSASGGKMVALALGITSSVSVSKGRKWSYSSHISPFCGFNIPFSSLGVEESTAPWIYCCPRPGQTLGRLLLAKIKGQWLQGSQPTMSSRYNLASNTY